MDILPIKLNGITSAVCLAHAAQAGAAYAGFIFYPHPTRHVTPATAGELARGMPHTLGLVGAFMDAGDEVLEETLSACPLDAIHLHGDESPERVRMVKRNFPLPIIKTLRLKSADDLKIADDYYGAADMLHITGAPASGTRALHAGQDWPCDWNWLRDAHISCPWFLAGGITLDTVAEAATLAPLLDFTGELDEKPGLISAEKLQKACTTLRAIYAKNPA